MSISSFVSGSVHFALLVLDTTSRVRVGVFPRHIPSATLADTCSRSSPIVVTKRADGELLTSNTSTNCVGRARREQPTSPNNRELYSHLIEVNRARLVVICAWRVRSLPFSFIFTPRSVAREIWS